MKSIILQLRFLSNCFSVFFVCLAFFHIFGATLSAELSMTVEVDRAVIYKGERITYQIVIADSAQVDDSIVPNLSGYNDFDVRAFPRQLSNNSGSSLQVVINGKVVRQESSMQSRAIFTYELAPKREGDLLIPAPVVMSGGRRLVPVSVKVADQSGTGNIDGSIPVVVKSPEEQDIVKTWIETDHNKLYPFQPFNVTLVIQVKSLPSDVVSSDTSPIAVLRDPPNITIAWANDDLLPKGLRPAQVLNDWLSSVRALRSQRGFSINEYATRGVGFDDNFFNFGSSSGFGDIMNEMVRGQLLHFARSPKKVVVRSADGAEVTYWEYRLTRKFIPHEIGEYNFDAILKGGFAVENRNSRDGASLKRIYAVAPEVLVNVVDVPIANRPESYVGAFGKFKLTTDIQPRKAKRGEPMTLTLKLVGEGSTGNVKPPDLTANQEITANFKTHSPTEEGDDHSCTFTYPIRATQSGQVIFPSIPITYFDVQDEKFVTLRSEAITLEISDSEQLNGGFNFGNNNSNAGNFERSEQGLLANMTNRSDAVDQSIDYFRWFASIVGICLSYLFVWVFLLFWRRVDSDPQRHRRQGALGRAKNRVARVRQNLRNDNSLNAVVRYGGELQDLLFGYIADLGCVLEHGMTTNDACKKYKELGGDEKLSESLRNVLEALDGAKYGGLDLRSLDDLVETIEHILAHPINPKK
ncbi:MAG: BatD family protein [Planctomycetaceae bacterium]|nr:BatD family protein [Planctomycetaceae bacterium]